MRNKKLAEITPVIYSNPELRKQMYDCVTAALRSTKKITGYAFVSFHEGGAFHAYYNPPPGVDSLDIPHMAKTRLSAAIVRSIKDV